MRCTKITQLAVAGSPRLSEGTIHSAATCLPGLQELDCDGCCFVYDGTILQALGEGCPQLLKVQLRGHFEMPPTALNELVFNSSQLLSLKLAECSLVDDEAIAAITRFCVGLEELDLTLCSEVGDPGLNAIAHTLPQLRALQLYGLGNVTDDGIVAVCEGCLQLRDLDVSWCLQLTDRSLAAVATQLKMLETLRIDGCSTTEAGEAAVVEGCTMLKQLDTGNSDAAQACTGAYGSMIGWDQESEIVAEDVDWSMLPL